MYSHFVLTIARKQNNIYIKVISYQLFENLIYKHFSLWQGNGNSLRIFKVQSCAYSKCFSYHVLLLQPYPLIPLLCSVFNWCFKGSRSQFYIIYVCLKGIQASFPFYEFQEFMQNNYNPLELLESKHLRKYHTQYIKINVH